MEISQHEYKEMQRQIAKLEALEAGGVDNWEFYSESLRDWSTEDETLDLADSETAKTEIFANLKEFQQRPYKSTNGVSPEFAECYPDYENDNYTNQGCWNCLGCTVCDDCRYCSICTDCLDCRECIDCILCIDCRDCRYCRYCRDCTRCTNCVAVGRGTLEKGSE